MLKNAQSLANLSLEDVKQTVRSLRSKYGVGVGAFTGRSINVLPYVHRERAQALITGAIKQKAGSALRFRLLTTRRLTAVWPVVTIVAVHVVACGEAFLVDGLGYLDLAQWRTAEVSSVAVGTGSLVALRLTLVR